MHDKIHKSGVNYNYNINIMQIISKIISISQAGRDNSYIGIYHWDRCQNNISSSNNSNDNNSINHRT